MVHVHRDGTFDEDEQFDREGGVFVGHRSGTRDVGPDEPDIPNDYPEDPASEEHVPGTVDDLNYDYGIQLPKPTDELLSSSGQTSAAATGVGRTGADDDREPAELGREDQRELWRRQRALNEESEEDSVPWDDVGEDLAERFEETSGEDAAEVNPENPEGESATGSE